MKRTGTVFISIATAVAVMAIASAPVAASTGYPSITRSITGAPGFAVAQKHQTDDSSINGTLHAPAPKPKVGSSVSSIVGASESAAVPVTTVVRERSGFDWGDAFVGAGGALVLALMSLATAHVLRRHRTTLESHV
jgi:hypothetical protein